MARIFVLLFFFLLTSPARAEQYVASGGFSGSFCGYLGFACSYRQIDALSTSTMAPTPLRRFYPDVSEFKGDENSGQCWINLPTGYLARIWDWWSDSPTFLARKADGTFENLGRPDFIVFACRKRAQH
jgi:hypothetical protein